MSDIRKLLESIDAINEASFKTVANGEGFLRDVFGAFGGINGIKNQPIQITATLKGANVLEYSINVVEPSVSTSEEENKTNRGYV